MGETYNMNHQDVVSNTTVLLAGLRKTLSKLLRKGIPELNELIWKANQKWSNENLCSPA